MQYNANKIREYIQLLDTIGKEYDFEIESASFFNVNKIKPELFIKNNIDEKDALTIINALLEHGIMPDYASDYVKKSLIELAIINKCSVEFIKELIDITSKYNLDVVGIASLSLKGMIDNNYSFDELYTVIAKFFEYGYNYLNECEKNNSFLGYFKDNAKCTNKNYKKLIELGKKGYTDTKKEDLLFMYKNTGINPKNIINYLLNYIKEYDNVLDITNIDLICGFFKCNLDRKVKMLTEIGDIYFEISKTSKAYNGLKITLDILLSEDRGLLPEALYSFYCSLLVQKDVNLLTFVLYKYKNYCDFDFDYYGKAMLDVASNILNEKDFMKLKSCIIKYGYKESSIEIEKINHIVNVDDKTTSNDNVNQNEQNYISEEFKEQGRVLNNIKYISMPGVGRDEEIQNVFLGLARRNGSVILVGESGVGKTEIAHRLAWQIQNNQCPDFLKNRIIVELSINNLIAGCVYRGSFEEKMKELFKKTKKYNTIVVINEIHNIYGLGSSADHSYDFAEMLKTEIEDGNIQVIGTTTEDEYAKYFTNSALKRRFKKVEINELDEGLLFSAFEKHINDLCELYNVTIDSNLNIDKVIGIIVNNTRKRCRLYNDRENNPALGIAIIEDAFAYVRVYNKEVITIDEFIGAFNSQDRIYDTSKLNAIRELESLKEEKSLVRKKANIIDISSLKR